MICAGVGPGDPELMTLKTARLIREADIVCVPGKEAREAAAYKIAREAVPELEKKELIALDMPMLKDREAISKTHKEAALTLEKLIDSGKKLLYLTLGDPTLYCSFSFLQHILEADGYEAELIPAVSSVTAAAARLSLPLCEWDEPLHIVPAAHKSEEKLNYPGNYVLMKSGSSMPEVKKLLEESGRRAWAAENCGMENEKIYRSLGEIPDDAGYFTIIIAKQP